MPNYEPQPDLRDRRSVGTSRIEPSYIKRLSREAYSGRYQKYGVLTLSPGHSTWKHGSADRGAMQHGETWRARRAPRSRQHAKPPTPAVGCRERRQLKTRCDSARRLLVWRPRTRSTFSYQPPTLSNSTARQNIRCHPRDAALPPVRTRHLEDPRIGQSNCRRALLPGRRARGPHQTSRARKPRRCRLR
jgi:hypothetical protein